MVQGSTTTRSSVVVSGFNRIALAVMARAKNEFHRNSINDIWKLKDKSMPENNEILTEAELKVLFVVMCVVSSEFEMQFKHYDVDRIGLIRKLQQLSGAE